MIVVEQVDSRHLAGNVIGDPSRRDLVVYLPPSYHTSARRYPAVYLLHGFGGGARSWTVASLSHGVVCPAIDDVIAEAISSHQATEMIVVMPDGWSKFGCSQWVDSPVNGHFEQYVTQDVVDHVDSRFRTIASRESRGVFGGSSGGLGAWHLGSRNPDVFGAMALLSADSYFDVTHKPWFIKFYNNIYPREPDGPVSGDFYSWLCYGLASCYTPNIDKPPFYVDFPIAYPSGDVIPHLWEKWLSYDPAVSWRGRVDNLRRLRGILLDVGYHDEYDLQYGHRILSLGLTGAEIAHQVEEHDGTHGSRFFERVRFALGWFSQVLNQADDRG
jgi:pimeloyl-ACP methyl ester carboxylesterase